MVEPARTGHTPLHIKVPTGIMQRLACQNLKSARLKPLKGWQVHLWFGVHGVDRYLDTLVLFLQPFRLARTFLSHLRATAS